MSSYCSLNTSPLRRIKKREKRNIECALKYWWLYRPWTLLFTIVFNRDIDKYIHFFILDAMIIEFRLNGIHFKWMRTITAISFSHLIFVILIHGTAFFNRWLCCQFRLIIQYLLTSMRLCLILKWYLMRQSCCGYVKWFIMFEEIVISKYAITYDSWDT